MLAGAEQPGMRGIESVIPVDKMAVKWKWKFMSMAAKISETQNNDVLCCNFIFQCDVNMQVCMPVRMCVCVCIIYIHVYLCITNVM